jgi:hypothetical protein
MHGEHSAETMTNSTHSELNEDSEYFQNYNSDNTSYDFNFPNYADQYTSSDEEATKVIRRTNDHISSSCDTDNTYCSDDIYPDNGCLRQAPSHSSSFAVLNIPNYTGHARTSNSNHHDEKSTMVANNSENSTSWSKPVDMAYVDNAYNHRGYLKRVSGRPYLYYDDKHPTYPWKILSD